ncbi:MAG: TniB protein [Firmicutes bacterium]|nr:TniB protein [Bacillota bacterium]
MSKLYATVEERMQKVDQLSIIHPRMKRVLEKIEYCHQMSKFLCEPQCLFISGQTGVGKTFIHHYYSRQYPANINEQGERTVSVVSCHVSFPITIKSLIATIGTKLDDENFAKGSIFQQTKHLENMVKERNVQLIIIDDMRVYSDQKLMKDTKKTMEWLNTFIDSTRIPFILIGSPFFMKSLKYIPKLDRRFAFRETLDAFEYKSRASQTEFRMLLKHIGHLMPFSEPSVVGDEEVVREIHHVTRGVIGNIMQIISRAYYHAIQNNNEAISSETLATAIREFSEFAQPQENLVRQKDIGFRRKKSHTKNENLE